MTNTQKSQQKQVGRPQKKDQDLRHPTENEPASANARWIAAEALRCLDQEGHALDNLLDGLLRTHESLSVRDRALAYHIAMGATRQRGLLDAALEYHMSRPLPPKQHWTRAVLRTALFQCHFMRVPAHAAINEAVALIKQTPRSKPLAGFVNAVLRKAASRPLTEVWATVADPDQRLALAYAYPLWLVRRWRDVLGSETALRQRLESGNAPAPLTLRIQTQHVSRSHCLAAWQQQGIMANPVAHLDAAVQLQNPHPVNDLSGFRSGWFVVQDGAAQWIAPMLRPQPGERILDACAAPGGKCTHLADLTQGKATIIAMDKIPERIVRLKETLGRLQIRRESVRPVCADATDSAALGALDGPFDKILLDVPCSATGVIRRHPDIKWRRGPETLSANLPLQRALLESAAHHLVSGGLLVYATCSLEPEENEKQIDQFLADHPDWRRKPLDPTTDGIPAELLTTQGDFQTEPGQWGMDGFFAARLTAP
jgi:16S rRNA (cytosine967-C5)-methyltransferase